MLGMTTKYICPYLHTANICLEEKLVILQGTYFQRLKLMLSDSSCWVLNLNHFSMYQKLEAQGCLVVWATLYFCVSNWRHDMTSATGFLRLLGTLSNFRLKIGLYNEGDFVLDISLMLAFDLLTSYLNFSNFISP